MPDVVPTSKNAPGGGARDRAEYHFYTLHRLNSRRGALIAVTNGSPATMGRQFLLEWCAPLVPKSNLMNGHPLCSSPLAQGVTKRNATHIHPATVSRAPSAAIVSRAR